MRQTSRARRILFVAAALVLAGAAAHADTIVLKNGRRISALSVRVEGDKVTYETSAGELSLPKSIVDHIEKGGDVPMGDSQASRGGESGDYAARRGGEKRGLGNSERRGARRRD